MLDNFCYNHTNLSLEQAKTYLALSVENDLQQQIIRNDHAMLVLTGGKSIVNLLPALQNIKLPWNKITLMLSDDRLIPSHNLESNERLIKENFLNKKEIKENVSYISIKKQFLEKWEDEYNDIVKNLKQAILILSMGQDGHIASLFAANDLLGEIGLKYIPRSDFKRVSLSYQGIMSAYKIYIIVYGNKKIDVFNRININNFYLNKLFVMSKIILIRDSN